MASTIPAPAAAQLNPQQSALTSLYTLSNANGNTTMTTPSQVPNPNNSVSDLTSTLGLTALPTSKSCVFGFTFG